MRNAKRGNIYRHLSRSENLNEFIIVQWGRATTRLWIASEGPPQETPRRPQPPYRLTIEVYVDAKPNDDQIDAHTSQSDSDFSRANSTFGQIARW
ncbi:unnamed protein product [Mesocestoides corti]|uniref:Uncharacterized protein n=1 Tax=Mesocestoides corti TaxID=53468 RepID=A0A0R3UPD7_MESCO|nr:unnamed protein product [Mesocestoides corti]